jgi:hypothetical protein
MPGPPDRCDAIMLPPDYLNTLTDTYQKLSAINLRFRAMLGLRVGDKAVTSCEMTVARAPAVKGSLFLHAAYHETLLYPNDHPKAGQDRYRWSEPDAEGVRFGVLADTIDAPPVPDAESHHE